MIACVGKSSVSITADDYGLAGSVNDGIEALAAMRGITAVSVMVHEHAELSRAAVLPSLGVSTGLHLTFVGERPLAPQSELRGLVDDDGRLPTSYASLFARLLQSPTLTQKLRIEAHAQLLRYRSLGLPLHFINSHQHVHVFPPVWRALRDFFVAEPQVHVRHASVLFARAPKQFVVNVASLVSSYFSRIPNPGVSPLAIGVAGRATADDLVSAARTWVQSSRERAAEVVVHPGFESPELVKRYGHWRYRWYD